jgi:hypothetical protein
MLNWDTSKEDTMAIHQIAKRAVGLVEMDLMDAEIGLTACHLHGCRLDLEKLADATDMDLVHDIVGIGKHIDRETGELCGCFVPRCAAAKA